jgi:hypothetical protein
MSTACSNSGRAPALPSLSVEAILRLSIGSKSNDLSRYELDHEDANEYRQRMLANVAAFAFTMALLAIGIWLTVSIAHLRRTQDCVLMGRHDCVQITVTHN